MKELIYRKHRGQYLHYYKTESGWEFCSRKMNPYSQGNQNTDAVIIVPMFVNPYEEIKIVITEEYREPMQEWVYGFPAGLIDEGEDEGECVIRELKEETGLNVISILHITPRLWSSEGMTDENVVVVYVTVEGKPSTKFLQDNEKIRTSIINSKEAENLIQNPDCSFGKVGYFILKDFAHNQFHDIFKSWAY